MVHHMCAADTTRTHLEPSGNAKPWIMVHQMQRQLDQVQKELIAPCRSSTTRYGSR